MVATRNNKSSTGQNGGTLLNLLVSGGVDVPDDKVIDDIFTERSTQHAADAIDYEDIDELADEDEDLPEEETGALHGAAGDEEEQNLQDAAEGEFDAIFGDDDDGTLPQGDLGEDVGLLQEYGNVGFADDDGLHGLEFGFEDRPARKRRLPEETARRTAKLRQVVKNMENNLKSRLVAKHFPEYRADRAFNHHTMVQLNPRYYAYKRPNVAFRANLKPLIPNRLVLEVAPDQRKAFRSNSGLVQDAGARNGIVSISDADLQLIEEIARSAGSTSRQVVPLIENDVDEQDKFADFGKDLILATAEWDDDAILEAGATEEPQTAKQNLSERLDDDAKLSYEDDEIFEGNVAPKKLELNMNDPNLLFVPERAKQDFSKTHALIPADQKQLLLKFNFSNDNEYEILKNNYNTKVRSQLSNLNIEHSAPALRLQTPYYKIELSKSDARAFHRARYQVRQGTLVCFSKLKVRKKKKDKGRTAQDIFSKTSDLTAADTSSLIAMEYSEEYPPVLSNFGMGSKLINYYRKEKDDDNSRPKAPLGETHVLGVEDRSPFWNFGHVAKGDFVPTLYNNMIRAPIFKQESKLTDFLLVRSQGCGNHQRHYLRPIGHLFAVGQTYPAVEVPAPHSRKVTNTSKNRLKMVVFRTMNKNGNARLSVKDISLHFPDQNDMQNRQRLKEFMEYQRQGEDQGYWKIRNSEAVPTEEEIRAMITPEDATLLDAMQHGLRVLDDIDSLYNENSRSFDSRRERKREKEREEAEMEERGEKKKKDKDADAEETVDEGLTPWSSSRNFIISNQTKAMLQLNGEGDPTGIGLGFSLLRATQKHGFRPFVSPPKSAIPKNTNASWQQKLYEQEVSRIWYSQRNSLTVGDGHLLEDIYREYKPVDHKQVFKSKFEKEREEKARENPTGAQNTALKITRMVKDENGIVQRKVEFVTDPRLIKAYIKRKKQIEGDKMSMVDASTILPTNDAEMNKIRRKALEEKIANLQKRAKLSKGRKPNSKSALHLAAAAGGTIIDANTVLLPDGSYAFGGKGIGKGKSTTRRCANCGAFGHIRTKKACPLYEATQGGTVKILQEQKDILLAQYREKRAAEGLSVPSTPLGGGESFLPPPAQQSPPTEIREGE